MPDDDQRCAHHASVASHTPMVPKPNGWMWVDQVRCVDCPEMVTLRVFDDPRDDRARELLPPDGPMIRKDER